MSRDRVFEPDGHGNFPAWAGDSPLATRDDPPPPAREQLPLPRRAPQAHLAPQLRGPDEPGPAAPFDFFALPGNQLPAAAGDGRSAAAAFHAATRRMPPAPRREPR